MKLLDRNLMFKANLENVINAEISESINQEYTLSFSTFIEADTEPFLNHNHIVEVENNYFNIVSYRKYRNGGAKIISVECEHVSYNLNHHRYIMYFFTADGTPTHILSKILEGTGFTVGVVEFEGIETFSIQEEASRRTLLLEFASYWGGELKFDKYTVSLLQRRGILTDINFRIGKNITGIEKSVDARGHEEGIPEIAYKVNLIELRTLPGYENLEEFELGDIVRLLDIELGIDTNVRVVKYTYDPIRRIKSSVEIQNFFSTLSDTIFRIQRDSVIKGKIYHGIRISPEDGFEAIRSDGKARAYFNSDTLAMQAQNAVGEMQDKIYFDPVAGNYIFDGLLSATAIEAVSAEIDVVVSETIIVQNLYAEKGHIAELTVDQLETSNKVWRRLNNDISDLRYIKVYGQNIEFITATTTGTASAQLLNRKNQPLFWKDEQSIGYITTLETTPYPVMIYVYEEIKPMALSFEQIADELGTLNIPVLKLGRGDGVLPNSSTGRIFKGRTGIVIEYFASHTSERRAIILNDSGITFIGGNGTSGDSIPLSDIQFYDNGFISTYEDSSIISWDYTLNDSGYITQLTNSEGKNIVMGWNIGNKP